MDESVVGQAQRGEAARCQVRKAQVPQERDPAQDLVVQVVREDPGPATDGSMSWNTVSAIAASRVTAAYIVGTAPPPGRTSGANRVGCPFPGLNSVAP